MNSKKTTFPKEIFRYLILSVVSGGVLFLLLFLGNQALYHQVIQPQMEKKDLSEATEEFQAFVTQQEASSSSRFTWRSSDGAVFYLRNNSGNGNEPKFHKEPEGPMDERRPLGTEKETNITYSDGQTATTFLVVENRWIMYIGIVASVVLGLIFALVLFYRQLLNKAKYMHQIEKGTIILEAGDLDYRIAEEGHDELTQIAASINKMSQSLSEKIILEAKATQTSREIISDLSHDIRTPLTILSGYLPVLLDTDLTEEQRKYLNLIHKKTQQMNNRVNDLLEYATIFSGQRPLELQMIDSRMLFEQFITELMPIAEVTYELDIPAQAKIVGDMSLLERLFDNLISNINQHAELEEGVTIQIQPQEDQLHVLIKNKVAKSDSSIGKSLGVKISAMIAELHQGQMISTLTGETYQTELVLPIKFEK
ncbi:HAMP domain-containing histidine kinase [Enterococcus sp. 669A]|uniref:histidine kinase n=1 Tax=Candidatus Enterococcus moelleringii TaxID=2815325 RepID=A0ABS3L562_9ENTE|nr:HAMP domain-containing sensor histidine kinase [Enterococcus sp. 669A]MBO1304715.1 HAMP domain-containing histidine kinase [Enterococcus sp. 669A]